MFHKAIAKSIRIQQKRKKNEVNFSDGRSFPLSGSLYWTEGKKRYVKLYTDYTNFVMIVPVWSDHCNTYKIPCQKRCKTEKILL